MTMFERNILVECNILIIQYEDNIITKEMFIDRREELISRLKENDFEIPDWIENYSIEEQKNENILKRIWKVITK